MNCLRLVGLGPGAEWQLPGRNLEALQGSRRVFLRTSVHPSVVTLDRRGIRYTTFDRLYEESATFDEVYSSITQVVLDEAASGGVVAYAVPGHPFFGEATVARIVRSAKERGIRYEVYPAMSFLDVVCATLEIDPLSGLEIVDGCAIDDNPPSGVRDVVVSQIYNRKTASDVKLALMTRYPDEHEVALVYSAGVAGEERVSRIPLYDLDRIASDHLTTLYVPRLSSEKASNDPAERVSRWPLDPIVGVIARLRGPDGCPWDREQTHESLRQYVIEEAYEVVDAVNQGDTNKLCEELGDLLLQVVLHSRIAEEGGAFDVNRVVDVVTRKMIRRHAHVFGGKKAASSDEVVDRWDAIKRSERGEREERGEPVEGGQIAPPKGQPALMRAYEVQRAAARVGFDWERVEDVLGKVQEEVGELISAVESRVSDRVEDEIGDVLFSVVNACRFLGINPEVALSGTVKKFINRFGYIEAAAARMGKDLIEMTLKEMDALWEESKSRAGS
ncbi:MAG: nucleoside triphosphate pyrophosphohydrolase [Firmicutes bacterium]|nr:nucleoside triphosphate pyrophosphohydrolase [Bacillota bacterium]